MLKPMPWGRSTRPPLEDVAKGPASRKRKRCCIAHDMCGGPKGKTAERERYIRMQSSILQTAPNRPCPDGGVISYVRANVLGICEMTSRLPYHWKCGSMEHLHTMRLALEIRECRKHAIGPSADASPAR